MMTRFKLPWLLASAVLLSVQICRADAPAGSLSFHFGSSTPIWDLTGGYQVNTSVPGSGSNAVPVSVGFDLTEDSHGFLSGSGDTIIFVGNSAAAGNYVVGGKVRRSGGESRVSLRIRVFGRGTFAGLDVPYNVTIVISGVLDAGSGQLAGTARTLVNLGAAGHGRGLDDGLSLGLPSGMDGSWDLSISILGLRPLGGTGTVTLANGRTFDFKVGGRYLPGADETRLKLTGRNGAGGSALAILLDGSLGILNLKGTVAGQAVSE